MVAPRKAVALGEKGGEPVMGCENVFSLAGHVSQASGLAADEHGRAARDDHASVRGAVAHARGGAASDEH